MNFIRVRNVHEALPEGLRLMAHSGVYTASRNGPVLRLRDPLVTEYDKPMERVMFWSKRDANPFFHLMEAMWMLAGRNDVAFLAEFNSNIANYSDDGKTFHGAYGARWRNHFGFDQLPLVIRALQEDHFDRRQVIGMWDPMTDLDFVSKDLPCNTHAYPQINPDGALDLTVCNRSNDMVWGAYGANAVHFSFLQEYLAHAIGVPVGRYFQFSANTHLYVDRHEGLLKERFLEPFQPYSLPDISPFPLISIAVPDWDFELEVLLRCGPLVEVSDPFLNHTVAPMWRAYRAWKSGQDWKGTLSTCASGDWRTAGQEWLARRARA